MKPALLLCLTCVAALASQAARSQLSQPVQPFTAVVWTTTTQHASSGKASTFMQRTVYSRDASGNVQREIYQPTKGLQHDTAAPLERVLTGVTSAQTPPQMLVSSEETLEQIDLGTLQFSGVPAKGSRNTFKDANGKPTHTVEMWFSPTLGLTVHMQSSNAHGDIVFSDLSDLHFGNPVFHSTETPVATPAIPILILYRSLFAQIAHMERYRQADDPNRHVNMNEIEDHLRKKMSLSTNNWQTLVDKSVKVESYTDEMSKQARTFANQARTARRENLPSANTPAANYATLHKMQLDFDTHVQGEIDQLKATVGPDATDCIQAYLKGTLTASTSVISVKASQLHSQQALKEQAR